VRAFDAEDLLNADLSEATKTQIGFLRSFLFDKSCTEENWHDSMNALAYLFMQQMARSESPKKSLDNAIELLSNCRKAVEKDKPR
jgi:hypothetical protein